MPIYEYACGGCGRDMEIWQKMSEKSKKVCPECGAHKLERLISRSAFHLKGSGWYVTDYAKGKSASGGTSPGKSETSTGKSDASTATKSETSTATKSETSTVAKSESAKPASDK